MKKYKKIYFDYYGYCEQDIILCENCPSVAVDIHHIDIKGMGGSKTKDYIENLVAVCRICHRECHASKEFNKKVKEKHLRNV